jgi:hypothetical protein
MIPDRGSKKFRDWLRLQQPAVRADLDKAWADTATDPAIQQGHRHSDHARRRALVDQARTKHGYAPR